MSLEAILTTPAAPVATPTPPAEQLTQKLGDNPALKDVLKSLKVDETPTEAPKVEAVQAEKKEEDRFSKKFAELSRRDKELVKQRQELSEKEKKFSEYEKKIKDANEDPLAFLEANGLSYEKITELILSGTKRDPAVKKLEQELKAEKEIRQQREVEAQKAVEERALFGFKAERQEQIKKAGEKYELVNAFGNYDLVHDVTQEHFDKTKGSNGIGEILNLDQAAEMVENYLESELKKVQGASKLKKLLGIQKESEPAKDMGTAGKPVAKSTTTLSNNMALDATEPSAGLLSRDESVKRASRLLKWD